MSSEATITNIPKINLSGLELQSEAWVAARAQVMEAMDTVGFFTVAFDEVSDELLDELFGSVAKSLFSAPLELKMKLISDEPFHGYFPERPGYKSERHQIQHPPESIRAFTDHLWPAQGNPTVCDALTTYSKKLYKLELIVKRMILEGLGIEEHFNSLLESNQYEFSTIKYSAPDPENPNMIVLGSHKDSNLLTILYQHQHQGLEVLAKSGDWLYPSPKTFIILAGESFEAYSNGRIKASLHRVRLHKELKETRYSLGFASQFRNGFMIEIPKELVNDEHPKLYKPFEYISYLFFRISKEGAKAEHNTLKAYCGVSGDEIIEA